MRWFATRPPTTPTGGGDPGHFPTMVEDAKLVGWEAGSDTEPAMADFGYAVPSLVPGLPPAPRSRNDVS